MEQLEASMHQGLERQMTSFNLPSKILCKVINIQRRVVTAGQPRRHLLTTGWSVFVSSKKLVAGFRRLEKMGSEGPKAITIHVTGFKKFLGVSENPTEKIANYLKSYVEKRGLPSGLSLSSCTVLETAGGGAKSQLYDH